MFSPDVKTVLVYETLKKKKKMKKTMLYYKSSTNIMVFTDVRQLVLYLIPSISNLELSTEETGPARGR